MKFLLEEGTLYAEDGFTRWFVARLPESRKRSVLIIEGRQRGYFALPLLSRNHLSKSYNFLPTRQDAEDVDYFTRVRMRDEPRVSLPAEWRAIAELPPANLRLIPTECYLTTVVHPTGWATPSHLLVDVRCPYRFDTGGQRRQRMVHIGSTTQTGVVSVRCYLPPDDARALARALTEAADKAEQM
jgi:hypothetical protein